MAGWGVRVTRVLFLFSGVLVALALLACGEDPPEATPTNPPTAAGTAEPPATSPTAQPGDTPAPGPDLESACAVLRPEDVQPLLGAVPAPTGQTVGPFASCSYWQSGASFVQFQYCRCLQGDALEASLQGGAAALGVELRPVDGVGGRAFWLEGILWVQQGDVVFNLWISLPRYFQPDGTALSGRELEAAALPDAIALAQALLPRIP